MGTYYMPAPVAPDKLRFWIAARGHTHAQFARKLGISINTVANWTCGASLLQPHRKAEILKICEVLEITPLDLVADGNDTEA